MRTADLVGRLETLLARVRTRAAEPRSVAAAALPVAPSPPTQPLPPEPVAPVVPAPPVPPVLAAPAPVPVAPFPAPEVHVAEAVAEAPVDAVPSDMFAAAAPEPAAAPENAESRERLIVAAPLPEPSLDTTLELDEPLAAHPAPMEAKPESQLDPSEVDVVLEEPVEEAPVSSRRAVVAEPQERLSEMAFGAEEQQAPRHTPPPESGRLPAAPEEAGVGDITGVREASSLPLPQAAARVLTAEPTAAQLQPSDAVAQVIGDALDFAPASFLALLDASLAL